MSAPPPTVRRFWSMVAHYHGQVWNSAEPARSLGVSEPTVRRYLDFLTGADLVRQLQPWFENLGKRQVKSPKVYVRDSGLLHALFNLGSLDTVLAHPKAGASWEGFLLEEVLKAARPDEAYFWATHQGAELDLLMFEGQPASGRGVQARRRADAHALDAHRDAGPEARCAVRAISGPQAIRACGSNRGSAGYIDWRFYELSACRIRLLLQNEESE